MSKVISEEGAKAVEQLEVQVKEISGLLAERYNNSPSVKEKEFLSSYDKDIFNESLKSSKTDFVDRVVNALETIRSVKAWISLLVPVIQDGGNFGVGIQTALIKMLKDSLEEHTKLLSISSVFHEKRSAIVEKALNKESNEEKTTEVLESIEKDKTGKSVTKTQSVVQSAPNDETLQFLASLDVNLYVDMKFGLIAVRDTLAVLADFIGKNKDKLNNPRGTVNNSSYMY